MPDLDPQQLRPLCSLDDETRRRLYEFVVAAREPVTRDAASAALDLDRSLVAYHLDRLADEGLLSVSFARPEGRGGPGAGRPAKRYERADVEVAVSVPPRDYQLAAEILVRAAEEDRSGRVRSQLEAVARQLGEEQVASSSSGDLLELLQSQGYEPYVDGEVIRLRNCPFHRLAQDHIDLVCGMNLAMLSGVLASAQDEAQAHLDPIPGHCCVTFVRE